MPPPVLSVQRCLCREHRTGPVADQWHSRYGVIQLRCKGFEFIENRIQQLRMEGVAGLQPGAAGSVLAAGGDDRLQVLAGTGQHRVLAVVGAHRNPGEPIGGTLDVLGISEHRHHPPAGRQAAEQPATFGDQPRAVLEAEHSRDTGRRVLTHTVTQNDVRFDTP